MFCIGQRVRFRPSGFERHKEDSGRDFVTGVIIAVNPKRHTVTVEAAVNGVRLRETFKDADRGVKGH